MPSVAYPASFGHQTKQVDISQVSGAGGERAWHIMVDRYLVATLRELDGEIRVSPVYGNWMTGDDIQALTEVINGMIFLAKNFDRQ